MNIFMLFENESPVPFSLTKRRGVNWAVLLNFGLKIICLFFFCDYLRILRENYFANVAVNSGCGLAALEYFFSSSYSALAVLEYFYAV
ncbi:hypothetical protein ACX8XP_16650 [Calditrichota bacterium LG25]